MWPSAGAQDTKTEENAGGAEDPAPNVPWELPAASRWLRRGGTAGSQSR